MLERLRKNGNAACNLPRRDEGQMAGEVVVKRACLLVICLGLSLDAHAQVAGPDVDYAAAAAREIPTTTFRTGVDLVALNVVVTDPTEKFVTGLAQTDFAVFEDGVQQEVSFFAVSNIALDLAILLDTSASMTDKLKTAQQAAVGFVSTLRAGDRVSIIDIKDATKVLFPMGEDLSEARNAILATTARGGTALYNGTYLALKEMTKLRRDSGEVRRQAIVGTVGRRRYGEPSQLRRCARSGKTDRYRYLHDFGAIEDGRDPGSPRRASVFLAVRLWNESAGAGDRRAVVFPCRHI